MQNTNRSSHASSQNAASSRGRWYSYRTRKNQRRNEPLSLTQSLPSLTQFSAINAANFTSSNGSNAYSRPNSHYPPASVITYPTQYPQRLPSVGSQLYTQRQSQRGRANSNTNSSNNSTTNYNSFTNNHNKQSFKRNKYSRRRSRETIRNSMDEANASSLSFRMEVDDEREESEAHSQPHSHPQSQSHLPSSVGTEVKSSSVEESDICGFAYDPSTKRYYRIQSDASGSAIGFRKRDYERVRRETDRLSQFQMTAKQPPAPSSSHQLFDVSPQIKPIVTSLVQARELGYKSTQITNLFHCGLSESALLSASNTPNYTREVLPNHLDRLAGCQFLDVSKDGRTILGCWAVSNWGLPGDSRRTSSRIMCLNVSCDTDIVRRNGLLSDGSVKHYDWNETGNRYGLKFKATDNSIYVLDPNLVDMVTAPVDSDVTCVLYVTASSRLSQQRKLTTYCRVFIEPIPELSSEEGFDEMSSPIYNIRWTCTDEIWSCGWNANKMRIGLGMEENTMIVDVVSEQNFRISSKKKNVLSQQFSQDGDLLYMGLCGGDMVCSDLRLKSHHIVNTFEESNSVGWIRLLKTQPHLILTENFAGELKLWDVRSRKTLISFEGHKNSHYRLPCFVDNNEKFVFAVGEDGTSRGWSLRTGNLLCALPSPRPIEQRTDFPRIVYSENWAARAGNSAIVIAVEGDIRVHQLTL